MNKKEMFFSILLVISFISFQLFFYNMKPTANPIEKYEIVYPYATLDKFDYTFKIENKFFDLKNTKDVLEYKNKKIDGLEISNYNKNEKSFIPFYMMFISGFGLIFIGMIFINYLINKNKKMLITNLVVLIFMSLLFSFFN